MQSIYKPVVLIANDETLTFREVEILVNSPNGAQILEAASVSNENALLLQRLPSGDLEAIRQSEKPDLNVSAEFILSFGDRTYNFRINDAELVWGARHISGATLRKLSKTNNDFDLFQIKGEDTLRLIEPETIIDLNRPGVETFITSKKIWKLKVQSVILEYDVKHIKVGDAMKRAGYDPTKAWDIFLIVSGQPKQKVDVEYIVDLTIPGVERIRLMQRNVDNGESAVSTLRREFNLLGVDVIHLNATGWKWETIADEANRWLLIHDYSMLTGYVPATVKLALLIPMDYPQAQIDMFYFYPFVTRHDGKEIPSTQVRAIICGVDFQGWSRHRNVAQPWDPLKDNIATHLALVDSSLLKEFGE